MTCKETPNTISIEKLSGPENVYEVQKIVDALQAQFSGFLFTCVFSKGVLTISRKDIPEYSDSALRHGTSCYGCLSVEAWDEIFNPFVELGSIELRDDAEVNHVIDQCRIVIEEWERSIREGNRILDEECPIDELVSEMWPSDNAQNCPSETTNTGSSQNISYWVNRHM
tara:strand:+ start:138 stop:644 length:507 start_codon:yes stop_codon:yes gene_type:complete